MDSNDWYTGRFKGVTGLVPSNYLQEIPFQDESFGKEEVTEDLEKQRSNRIINLVTIQSEFNADLQKFISGFVKPLKDSAVLSRDQFEALFPNIDSIKDASAALVQALNKAQNKDELDKIGTLLLSKMALFNTFIPYCVNYPRALAAFQEDMQLPNFAKIAQNFTQGQFGVVEKYLMKPFQHISKIPTFVEKILETTPANHPDFQAITQVYEQVESIRKVINEESSHVVEALRVKQIQIRFSQEMKQEGQPIYSEADRLLVKEGQVMVNDKGMRCFLFEDFVLFTSKTNELQKQKYFIVKKFALKTINVELIQSNDEIFPLIKKLIQAEAPPVPEKAKANLIIKITDNISNETFQFKGTNGVETESFEKAIVKIKASVKQFQKKEFQLQKILTSAKNVRATVKTKKGYFLILLDTILFLRKPLSEDLIHINGVDDVSELRVNEDNDQLFVTINNKQNSIFLLKLSSILANPNELANFTLIQDSMNTFTFEVGLIHGELVLVGFTAKMINFYQYNQDQKAFPKIASLPYPCNYEGSERTISFLQKNCFFSLNNKFFLFNDQAQFQESGVFGNKTKAIAAFDTEGAVFLVYEDRGEFVDESGKPLEGRLNFKWFNQAKGASMRDGQIISILSSNGIEYWNLKTGNFIDIGLFPNIKLINRQHAFATQAILSNSNDNLNTNASSNLLATISGRTAAPNASSYSLFFIPPAPVSIKSAF